MRPEILAAATANTIRWLLYQLLEQEVVPAFYDRDAQGIPRRWLQVVKQSIRTVLPQFSTRRMVKEYVRTMYQPALGQQAVAK